MEVDWNVANGPGSRDDDPNTRWCGEFFLGCEWTHSVIAVLTTSIVVIEQT